MAIGIFIEIVVHLAAIAAAVVLLARSVPKSAKRFFRLFETKYRVYFGCPGDLIAAYRKYYSDGAVTGDQDPGIYMALPPNTTIPAATVCGEACTIDLKVRVCCEAQTFLGRLFGYKTYLIPLHINTRFSSPLACKKVGLKNPKWNEPICACISLTSFEYRYDDAEFIISLTNASLKGVRVSVVDYNDGVFEAAQKEADEEKQRAQAEAEAEQTARGTARAG